MYVTRPLSLYYNSPNAITEPPPEGPNLGILVIEDKEAEQQATCCGGLVWTTRLYDTPFPQNKMIKVRYSTGVGENQHTYRDDAYFIPVIGQPLSANRYYVIRADGKHKGKTCECSKEEDMTTFCLCTFVNDVKPTIFDPRNLYQQVQITTHRRNFRAVSVASDGIPQSFLKRKGWIAYTSKPSHYSLTEALGINTALRMQLPGLDFPSSTRFSRPAVVGKWYCPYIFIKEEGLTLKDQMKRSMFYEMSLEQYWEEIYSCENLYGDTNKVSVGVSIRKEMAFLNGREGVNENVENVEGVVWFKNGNSIGNGLGLSLPIWERMRWEQARGGFVGGDEVERIERVFNYEGESGWSKFGCYVLLEKFVLTRMDGSLALSYEFKHSNKIRFKWE